MGTSHTHTDTMSDAKDATTKEEEDAGPHFEPLVSLPEVETKHGEEDEEALFTMRSKLFRFDRDLKEWKERGTGNVRFMQHKTTKKIRLLMRRERTLKVCANHVVTDGMKLEPNASSDRSWVYTCPADFADGEAKVELLAIRFANSDDANAFKAQFEAAQKANTALEAGEAAGEEKKEEEKKADEEDKAPEGETGDEDTDDLAAAFKAALESLSQYDTPEKVEAAMKKADTSGDGEIS